MAPIVSGLDSFLADQQTGLFDSSGEFTIAADKALKKLAASQLQDPALWVLKLVQFGSHREADQMDFEFGRNLTKVHATFPKPISVYQFQKGLDQFEPLEDRGLEHLVVGLRALGSYENRRFALKLSGPEGTEFLIWDGSKLKASHTPEQSRTATFTLEVTGAKWTNWFDPSALATRSQESKYLFNRAFTAPFPLKVDGVLLKGRQLRVTRHLSEAVWTDYAPEEAGFGLPMAFKGLIQESPKNSRSPEVWKVAGSRPRPRVSACWDVLYHYGIDQGLLSVFPRPVVVVAQSELHWLMDGVVIESEPLTDLSGKRSPFSLQIFVDASECPTDIGGLKFRLTEGFQQRRHWVVEFFDWLGSLAKEVLPTIENLTGYTASFGQSLSKGLTHMPLNGKMQYRGAGVVANSLRESKSVRQALLRAIQQGQSGFEDLRFESRTRR